ncbi:hypothetical protein Fmac_031206 [Flemingia macrophylla]|uniref:FHA domain-containing protein n=1 Tax=Flemingia macrophylla TaxID=520843 RepID=A0ABD1L2N7_9FABA
MVWGLFPVDPLSGEDKYYIFKKGVYKVGRKGCDVIITKDKGVSRVHAEIVVNTMNPVNPLPNERSHFSPSIHIRDCSKYGTFISKNVGSKKKVHELPNKETVLGDGDLVSFGTGTATYKFCHVPLVFFICSSNKVDQSLEGKISSIGASITHTLGEECTHVLVDQLMPLKKDLVDAVVAKKSCVLKTWLEFFAEKNISTEIPGSHSYIPTVSAGGESIKIADPRMREDCLKGYTFLLDSEHLYRFGNQLKSLLEVAGAKVVSFEGICSNSQVCISSLSFPCMVILISCKSDLFNKQSSLLRYFEITTGELFCYLFSCDLVAHILLSWSGQKDDVKGYFKDGHGLCNTMLQLMKGLTLLVSSSCSTDETVVADSETEVETATSAHSNEALSNENNLKYEKTEELCDDSEISDKRKHDRIEASCDDVSTRFHDIKSAKPETSLGGASVRSHNTSFRNDGAIKVKNDKADGCESGNSDIVYSQHLVVRDTSIPSGTSTAPNSNVPNFKRFRKAQSESGNSFDNLVPFAKYPYKDSDCGNDETAELVKEEKRRKKMEAVADELFNNHKASLNLVNESLTVFVLRN